MDPTCPWAVWRGHHSPSSGPRALRSRVLDIPGPAYALHPSLCPCGCTDPALGGFLTLPGPQFRWNLVADVGSLVVSLSTPRLTPPCPGCPLCQTPTGLGSLSGYSQALREIKSNWDFFCKKSLSFQPDDQAVDHISRTIYFSYSELKWSTWEGPERLLDKQLMPINKYIFNGKCLFLQHLEVKIIFNCVN